jgi:hypothetical protein
MMPTANMAPLPKAAKGLPPLPMKQFPLGGNMKRLSMRQTNMMDTSVMSTAGLSKEQKMAYYSAKKEAI